MKRFFLGHGPDDLPPRLLVAAGVVAWVLGSLLAFFDHSDGTAAAFVGAGLVLFLVASYFDRIEEAGPGGIKLAPTVKTVPPGSDTAAELSPTPEEEELAPPEELLPPDEQPSTEILRDEVQVFESLDAVPTPVLAALFDAVPELGKRPGARFVSAKRKRGRGNNPWLFEFRLPDEAVKTWRVSWGGQGKRSATVNRDHH
jgi:hypothetical protein